MSTGRPESATAGGSPAADRPAARVLAGGETAPLDAAEALFGQFVAEVQGAIAALPGGDPHRVFALANGMAIRMPARAPEIQQTVAPLLARWLESEHGASV